MATLGSTTGFEASFAEVGQFEVAEMDYATLLGIFVAFVAVVASVILGNNPLSFINGPSVLIVFVGTFAVTTACFTISEIRRAQSLMVKTVLYHAPDMQDEALKVIELADAARKNGVLSLQNYLDGREFNPYLVRAINLAIDGSDASDIERVMSQDIISMAERHRRGISIFRKSAEVAPGMGLIGTLIGLVQMLDKLEDPSSIGPAMAVALLTTLYGAILSFMFFSPLASKLERNSRDEAVIKNIYLQGAISIARVENPRNLQELLNTILPPAKRVQYFG